MALSILPNIDRITNSINRVIVEHVKSLGREKTVVPTARPQDETSLNREDLSSNLLYQTLTSCFFFIELASI